MSTPDPASARLATGFSAAGHFFNHLFEPVFFVVALVLPTAFGISYETALTLIVGGKVLLGVLAPAAGWLGDRWSATGMMAIYFLGMGAAALWAGLAGGPWEMAAALTALGLFASIYHPVGIAWLVRHSRSRGKALGLNGVFGSLGPAVAGLGAGAMIDWVGWRAAFIVPAVAMMAVGLFFVALLRKGVIVETHQEAVIDKPPQRGEAVRAYGVLVLGMLFGGLIYQATQASLPKLFDERLGGLLGDGALGAGAAVMVVYGFSALMQVFAGHLADRYPLRRVYLLLYVIQAPLLGAAAALAGLPLLVAAMFMVAVNTGLLPAENMLLARYTPARWRATAYGAKFVLGFGVASLGVPLVSLLRSVTGDFTALFLLLGACAAIVAAAAISLPGDAPRQEEAAPAPAE